MWKILKSFLSGFLILTLFWQSLPAFANAPSLNVVISEIAWAGSAASSSDEWIELYNNTQADIDLTGWKIIDDATTEYAITGGTIKAGGYFIIANSQNAAGITADFVKSISLANSGDTLILKDQNDNIIDEVNPGGAAWPAGDSASKLTMERIEITQSGAVSSNWQSSQNAGGTPKAGITINDANAPAAMAGLKVSLQANKSEFIKGEEFQLTAKVEDAQNLFAYGLDLNYDPEIFDFLTAEEGDFFAQSDFETSFQFGLEDGDEEEGQLVIADSIIEDFDEVAGLNGDGELFILTFKVLGENSGSLNFANTSFAADKNGEQPLTVSNFNITVKNNEGGSGSAGSKLQILNLAAKLGQQQYSLALNWTNSDAEKHQIFRLNQQGEYLLIGETAGNSFLDNDNLPLGGNLIPGLQYHYKVIPLKGTESGEESLIIAKETRGIKGDNDRSNRVDGRDLYQLALVFGAEMTVDNEYAALIDTSYDGMIDGEDLLDLAANWANTYQM